MRTSVSLWPGIAMLMLGPIALFAAPAAQAQETPPNFDAGCHCYRNVAYGSISWFEPTTKRMAHQVMDIWMPGDVDGKMATNSAKPIVYYGHPNGRTHTIVRDPNPSSLWSRLVKPLTDQGYVVVSYEFRHPVTNYMPGRPAPRYDIQKAINVFADKYAPMVAADPSNSFITGQSRGGGLGVLTALTGNFTGGTQVQAVWTYQAQTTFECREGANTFVIERDREAFMAACAQVPDAGSALKAVNGTAPPMHVAYDRPFFKQLVPASEIDIHFPDFGWRLCERFDAERVAASCDAAPNVGLDDAWVGVPEFFNAHRQAPA